MSIFYLLKSVVFNVTNALNDILLLIILFIFLFLNFYSKSIRLHYTFICISVVSTLSYMSSTKKSEDFKISSCYEPMNLHSLVSLNMDVLSLGQTDRSLTKNTSVWFSYLSGYEEHND